MIAPQVLLVGSLHTDLIARAAAMPTLGSSIIGDAFSVGPGGKAANQAGQLARLGVSCSLLARVGQDAMGDACVSAVASVGVDTSLIVRDSEFATGSSTIFAVDGEYASIIVPGAGTHFSADELEAAESTISGSQLVVGQLELPTWVTESVFAFARSANAMTVLNASPLEGRHVDDFIRLLGDTDVLVVNRVEAEQFSSVPIASIADAGHVSQMISNRFELNKVVITMGSRGAVLATSNGVIHQPAFAVEVVDTVGSGDAFLGGLIAGWVTGASEEQSLRLASAAGALAATKVGAFPSLPDLASVTEMADRRD